MGREKKPYCIKKKGDYYYYKLPSMKNYKSTELKSETKAEKYVLDLIKQIDKDNGVIIDTDKTFASYTKDYFIWNKCPYFTRRMRQGKNLTQRYCSECFRVLDTKIRPISWFVRKKMKDIRRKDILNLIDELCEKNTNGVVNDCISVLKLIFNDCIFREDIDRNPMTGIGKLEEKKKEKVPFTFNDYNRMFPINNEEEIIRLWGSFSKFICEFIECNTGMRNGEVRCLKWEDIDFDNNIIYVRHAFKDNSTNIIGLPKSKKTRLTGMCDTLKRMLIIYRDNYSNYTEPNDFVCCWEDGRPFRYETTKDTHKKVLKELGIKHRGQHLYRHSFNTNLRGNDFVSDLDIRTTTGWRSEEIQDNYTHTEIISSQNIRKGQDKIWKKIKKQSEKTAV